VSDNRISDVGVLDKVVALLDALSQPHGPFSLAQIAAATGIHRATAHRLLRSLSVHGLSHLDEDTRWSLGSRLMYFGERAAVGLPLNAIATPALAALRDATGESVQLFVRQSDERICIASLQSPHGLRTIVEVGSVMPLHAGSAGRILGGQLAAPDGWIESVGERETGVASVSAPIYDAASVLRAAVSVSGPIERVTRQPGERYGADVVSAAKAIARAAGWELRKSGQ
jgi:DNA-binding IclR family transcriptional regulator